MRAVGAQRPRRTSRPARRRPGSRSRPRRSSARSASMRSNADSTGCTGGGVDVASMTTNTRRHPRQNSATSSYPDSLTPQGFPATHYPQPTTNQTPLSTDPLSPLTTRLYLHSALDRAQILMPESTASRSICASSSSLNSKLSSAPRLSSSCVTLDAPTKNGRHTLVPQSPRQRHLRERLTPPLRKLVEGPYVRHRLVGEHLRVE